MERCRDPCASMHAQLGFQWPAAAVFRCINECSTKEGKKKDERDG